MQCFPFSDEWSSDVQRSTGTADDEQFSNSFLMDIAGNAFPGAVLQALVDSLLASVPWAPRENVHEGARRIAMEALGLGDAIVIP